MHTGKFTIINIAPSSPEANPTSGLANHAYRLHEEFLARGLDSHFIGDLSWRTIQPETFRNAIDQCITNPDTTPVVLLHAPNSVLTRDFMDAKCFEGVQLIPILQEFQHTSPKMQETLGSLFSSASGLIVLPEKEIPMIQERWPETRNLPILTLNVSPIIKVQEDVITNTKHDPVYLGVLRNSKGLPEMETFLRALNEAQQPGSDSYNPNLYGIKLQIAGSLRAHHRDDVMALIQAVYKLSDAEMQSFPSLRDTTGNSLSSAERVQAVETFIAETGKQPALPAEFRFEISNEEASKLLGESNVFLAFLEPGMEPRRSSAINAMAHDCLCMVPLSPAHPEYGDKIVAISRDDPAAAVRELAAVIQGTTLDGRRVDDVKKKAHEMISETHSWQTTVTAVLDFLDLTIGSPSFASQLEPINEKMTGEKRRRTA